MVTSVPPFWLDSKSTDALIGGPPAWRSALKGLALETIPNPFLQAEDTSIIFMIHNRTGKDLPVAKFTSPFGVSTHETTTALTAPSTELGTNMSSMGLWRSEYKLPKNPGAVVTFPASAATNNQPLYICGDITGGLFFTTTNSTSVRNDTSWGDGAAYYKHFISEGTDYGNSTATSGAVSAAGYEVELYKELSRPPGAGLNVSVLFIVAVIT